MNEEKVYTSDDGCAWESPKEYFCLDVMGMCGCGIVELKDLVWKFSF